MVKTWIFTVVAQVQFLFWRLRSHIKLLHVVAKKRKEKKKKNPAQASPLLEDFFGIYCILQSPDLTKPVSFLHMSVGDF